MILLVRGHINGKVLNMTPKRKWTIFEFDLERLSVTGGTS